MLYASLLLAPLAQASCPVPNAECNEKSQTFGCWKGFRLTLPQSDDLVLDTYSLSEGKKKMYYTYEDSADEHEVDFKEVCVLPCTVPNAACSETTQKFECDQGYRLALPEGQELQSWGVEDGRFNYTYQGQITREQRFIPSLSQVCVEEPKCVAHIKGTNFGGRADLRGMNWDVTRVKVGEKHTLRCKQGKVGQVKLRCVKKKDGNARWSITNKNKRCNPAKSNQKSNK